MGESLGEARDLEPQTGSAPPRERPTVSPAPPGLCPSGAGAGHRGRVWQPAPRCLVAGWAEGGTGPPPLCTGSTVEACPGLPDTLPSCSSCRLRSLPQHTLEPASLCSLQTPPALLYAAWVPQPPRSASKLTPGLAHACGEHHPSVRLWGWEQPACCGGSGPRSPEHGNSDSNHVPDPPPPSFSDHPLSFPVLRTFQRLFKLCLGTVRGPGVAICRCRRRQSSLKQRDNFNFTIIGNINCSSSRRNSWNFNGQLA